MLGEQFIHETIVDFTIACGGQVGQLQQRVPEGCRGEKRGQGPGLLHEVIQCAGGMRHLFALGIVRQQCRAREGLRRDEGHT
jgi:hypothetical protein